MSPGTPSLGFWELSPVTQALALWPPIMPFQTLANSYSSFKAQGLLSFSSNPALHSYTRCSLPFGSRVRIQLWLPPGPLHVLLSLGPPRMGTGAAVAQCPGWRRRTGQVSLEPHPGQGELGGDLCPPPAICPTQTPGGAAPREGWAAESASLARGSRPLPALPIQGQCPRGRLGGQISAAGDQAPPTLGYRKPKC